MVSMSNSSRRQGNNNKSGNALPVLYFALGAIFMSLFGRLSALVLISGRMDRNDLDPNVVESAMHMPMLRQQQQHQNVPSNEAEGGIPQTDSNQQHQHLTEELNKKKELVKSLQDQLDAANQQLEANRDKIAKYEEALEELYKSRKQYGHSENQSQSLNETLSKANDKIEQVKSILRGRAK
jgi:septal ring factor EnvC (AmiA/AmiB activator)